MNVTKGEISWFLIIFSFLIFVSLGSPLMHQGIGFFSGFVIAAMVVSAGLSKLIAGGFRYTKRGVSRLK
ncbi:MAG: hypothetical protein J07HQW1_01336 [Haloquadratum walsbyi J07HQW1]|jgi:hypothetical protein|uniref:Uncharacterized protein n=1 Tax=Haloquadratum walsbyi J07HQW1 TaxID=1238424 RepID=U1PCJ7_9EURY|nr:MAG: hypothetical protein J07HQW1_01336 [Haloquadratum walsbyi J07HQW1]